MNRFYYWSNFYYWLNRPAAVWQFWYPQSGFVGGMIMSGLVVGIIYIIVLLFFVS